MDPMEAIRKRIEEYKGAIALYLTSGACKSMEEYCRTTGKFEALEAVLDDIKDIEKRYIDDD